MKERRWTCFSTSRREMPDASVLALSSAAMSDSSLGDGPYKSFQRKKTGMKHAVNSNIKFRKGEFYAFPFDRLI